MICEFFSAFLLVFTFGNAQNLVGDYADTEVECSPQKPDFSSDGRKCLHIGGTVPMEGGWPGGRGCLPAIKMALSDVNKKKSLLPDYYLRFHYNDSKCNPGLGTRVLYDLLYNKPVKIALLSGCSSVSTTIAEAAPMWNLVVVSYGSSSPALSNRKRFPTFFRTHPSQAIHNPTRIKLFKHFGWQRIAILQELQELFTSTAEDLESRLKNAGMEVMTRQSFLADPSDAVKNLKRQDARIIVGIFYDNFAQRVFCEVYKQGLFGKKYVWFILGWYRDNWYEGAENNTNCTTEQLAQTLEHHFSIESLMLNQDLTVTISGMTAQEFITKLNIYFVDRKIDPLTVTGMAEAPLAYDAVWALALAFNKTADALKLRYGNRMYLEHFTYTDKYISNLLYQSMSETKFFGVSGMLTFTDSGDRTAWTLLEQMINGKYVKLAYYHHYDDNLTWIRDPEWPGRGPPSDRTLIKHELLTISRRLFWGVSIASAISILICIACAIFNRFYRTRLIIANSDPWYNDIMLLGNVMCLCAAVLFGIDGRLVTAPYAYDKICRARLWLFAMGFSFAFGALFTKVFKIHALRAYVKKDKSVNQLVKSSNKEQNDFTVSKVGTGIAINFLHQPKEVLTYNFFIPIFLACDVLFIIIWRVTDPLHKTLQDYPMISKSTADVEYKILPQLEVCYCRRLKTWLYILYGIKGMVLIFGVFMSFETRKVFIRQINDSKLAGIAIYNVVILCVVTVPMTLLITNDHNATFAFVSISIIVATLIATLIMFAPKVYYIWQRKMDDITSQVAPGTTHMSKEEEDKYQQLVDENGEILAQIAQKEKKIQELMIMLKKKQALGEIPLSK